MAFPDDPPTAVPGFVSWIGVVPWPWACLFSGMHEVGIETLQVSQYLIQFLL